MLHNCEAGLWVAAPPEAVWAVVSDVTRIGEWSGECRSCAWVGDVHDPVVGARFRGRNRRGGFRWTRLNEVKLVEELHTLVWQTLPRRPYPDSVEWRLSLTEDGTGTRVCESYHVLHLPRLLEGFLWLVMPAHRDRTADLLYDLGRLKEVVESTTPGGPLMKTRDRLLEETDHGQR